MWTALIMGFAGSLHCVGMCSPLALAASSITPSAVLNRVIYNLGRIFTYSLLGAAAGTLSMALPFDKFQNGVSLILGVCLLTIAVVGLPSVRVPFVTRTFENFNQLLKKSFGRFLQKKSKVSLLLMGAINGVLPCGLTFIALSSSLMQGSPGYGFIYMLTFGLGTLPAMIGFTHVLQWVVRKFHITLRQLTTVALFLSGCLLIARVFLMGHHHLSPEEQHMVDIVICR